MSDRTEDLTQATAPTIPTDGSYVDWAAIFGGAVVASAIAFVFAGFGAALGLSFISPYAGEGFATAAVIAAALWMLWTTISSFMAGGYLAGRMRRRVDAASADEVDVRDGAHGLMTWGVGVIIGAVMLSSAASTTAKITESTVSAAASTVGTVVEGAASAAGTATEAAADLAPMDYITNTMFRGDGSPRSQGALAMRDEAKQVLLSIVRTGDVPDVDRDYLVTVASNQTDLDEATINARVDDAIAAAQGVRSQAEQASTAAAKALADAEQAARDAAEAARVYSIISAFALAAALLIAGAGAYWAAGVGGRHRDEGRVFAGFGRWGLTKRFQENRNPVFRLKARHTKLGGLSDGKRHSALVFGRAGLDHHPDRTVHLTHSKIRLQPGAVFLPEHNRGSRLIVQRPAANAAQINEPEGTRAMNSIIYIVGLVVVVGAILSFAGIA